MKYKPHDYQTYATNFILTHPISAVLLDMGLGKSVITLTAICPYSNLVVLECEQNMKRPSGRNPVKAISIQKSRKHGMRNRRNCTSMLSACCTLSD